MDVLIQGSAELELLPFSLFFLKKKQHKNKYSKPFLMNIKREGWL